MPCREANGRRTGLFFFFSSRRRHTRFDCDWSSDVCSSDLLAGAPTTPLPRVPGKPGADHHKRSVGAGIALWVMVLAIGLGGPGLYAYKKGLLFFVRATPHDSAAALQQDTVAQRLLGDTGAPAQRLDTAAQRMATAPPPTDTDRESVV